MSFLSIQFDVDAQIACEFINYFSKKFNFRRTKTIQNISINAILISFFSSSYGCNIHTECYRVQSDIHNESEHDVALFIYRPNKEDNTCNDSIDTLKSLLKFYVVNLWYFPLFVFVSLLKM